MNVSVEKLREELRCSHELIVKQTALLLRSINAVKGDPGAMRVHSVDDLPEQVQALVQRLERAEAALAELIRQSRAPAVAYGCYGWTGVHFVSEDRDECVQEARRDGSRVVDLIVRPTMPILDGMKTTP